MLISIVITSYNYEKYLKDTVRSVINQSYTNWELIVIDDASTDASVEIIKEFQNQDNRIKLITNAQNLGLKKSIQKAVESASGEWIAFLESDDLWRKDYLEKKVGIINSNSHFGLIYNDVELFGENISNKFPKTSGEFPRNMFFEFGINNPILTMSSVMLKKNLFSLIDFNSPIDKLFDWYIYVQLARLTDFYYAPEKLTKWRQHGESYISSDKKCKFRFANISAYLKILRQEPFNIRLLVFIIFSTIGMCFRRLKYYLIR